MKKPAARHKRDKTVTPEFRDGALIVPRDKGTFEFNLAHLQMPTEAFYANAVQVSSTPAGACTSFLQVLPSSGGRVLAGRAVEMPLASLRQIRQTFNDDFRKQLVEIMRNASSADAPLGADDAVDRLYVAHAARVFVNDSSGVVDFYEFTFTNLPNQLAVVPALRIRCPAGVVHSFVAEIDALPDEH